MPHQFRRVPPIPTGDHQDDYATVQEYKAALEAEQERLRAVDVNGMTNEQRQQHDREILKVGLRLGHFKEPERKLASIPASSPTPKIFERSNDDGR